MLSSPLLSLFHHLFSSSLFHPLSLLFLPSPPSSFSPPLLFFLLMRPPSLFSLPPSLLPSLLCNSAFHIHFKESLLLDLMAWSRISVWSHCVISRNMRRLEHQIARVLRPLNLSTSGALYDLWNLCIDGGMEMLNWHDKEHRTLTED